MIDLVLLAQGLGHFQNHLFSHGLDGAGQVHVELGDLRFGLTRPPSEEGIEVAIGHSQAGAVVEVAHVELIAAIVGDVDQMSFYQLDISGLTIGGQPHQFVFAAVDLEAAVVGEGGVEQAEGVGEADLLEQRDVAAFTEHDRGGGPLAHTIHDQNEGAIKRRGVEGRGGVGEVVFGEEQSVCNIDPGGQRRQLFENEPFLKQLLLQPYGHRLGERAKAPWRVGVVGLQQAFELEKGLVVEDDAFDLIETDTGFGQTVSNCLLGKAGVVFLPAKALLLGGRDDVAILNQGGGAVVIEGGDAEDKHPRKRCRSKVPGRCPGRRRSVTRVAAAAPRPVSARFSSSP